MGGRLAGCGCVADRRCEAGQPKGLLALPMEMCRACRHEPRRTAAGDVRRDSSLCERTSPANVVVGLGAVHPRPQAGGSTKVTSSSIMERSSALGDGARRPKTARSAGDLACPISQLSCHCLLMCLLTTRRGLWTGMQIGPPQLTRPT